MPGIFDYFRIARCSETIARSQINVQIVPDHNLTAVRLTDLLQQFFFAWCLSVLHCPRLTTAPQLAGLN